MPLKPLAELKDDIASGMPLFHQVTDDEDYKCLSCGALNTLETDETPSMLGYGTDLTECCTACGATVTYCPFNQHWPTVSRKED